MHNSVSLKYGLDMEFAWDSYGIYMIWSLILSQNLYDLVTESTICIAVYYNCIYINLILLY